MNEILMTTVVELLQKLEKRIAELKEMVSHQPENDAANAEIISRLQRINDLIIFLQLPVHEIKELSAKLDITTELLRHPVKHTTVHHHHFPKRTWVIVGLLLLAGWFFKLWYSADDSLQQYKANDTKYRFLKINGNQDLREILHKTDSLYQVFPEMRDSVIEREKENQRKLERLKEAMELEQEAKRLRDKAGRK